MQLRTLLCVLFVLHCTHHSAILLQRYWNESFDEVTDVEFHNIEDKFDELNIQDNQKCEASNTWLPKVNENIRSELLEKTCVDEVNLATDIANKNKDVFLNLLEIQEQVNRIHRDTKRIVTQAGDSAFQYKHSFEKLGKMNKTMHLILSGIQSMLANVEQKMEWINDFIENESGRLNRMYETCQHFAYLFGAMIFAAFLQAPFVMRASIIGIVPLNIAAFSKHGSMDDCLGFTSVTTLIFLITGVHFLIMNRNKLTIERIQHQSNMELLFNAAKIRICDCEITKNVWMKQTIKALGRKLSLCKELIIRNVRALGRKLSLCKELIIRNVRAVANWIRQHNVMNKTQFNDSDPQKVLISDLQSEKVPKNDNKDSLDTTLSSDKLRENTTADSLKPSLNKTDIPNDNKMSYTFSDGNTTKRIAIKGIDFPDLPLNKVSEKLTSEAMRSQTKVERSRSYEKSSNTFNRVPEISAVTNDMIKLIDKVPTAKKMPDVVSEKETKSSAAQKVQCSDFLHKESPEHPVTKFNITLAKSSSDQKESCWETAFKEARNKVRTTQEKNGTDSEPSMESSTVQRVSCSNPSVKEMRESLVTDTSRMTNNETKSICEVDKAQEKNDTDHTTSPNSGTIEQVKCTDLQKEVTDLLSGIRKDKVENANQVKMTHEGSDIVPGKATKMGAVPKVPRPDLSHEETPKYPVTESPKKHSSPLQDDTKAVAVANEKSVADLTDRPQDILNRPVGRVAPNVNSTDQPAQQAIAPLDRNRIENHSVSPPLPNMRPSLPQDPQIQRTDVQSSVGSRNPDIPIQTEARGNTTINILNNQTFNNFDHQFSVRKLIEILNPAGPPSSTVNSVPIRPLSGYCGAMTQKGTPCRNKPSYGGPRCWRHTDDPPMSTSICVPRSIGYINDEINYSFDPSPIFQSPARSSSSLSVSRSGSSGYCGAMTQKGTPCRNRPSYGGSTCWRH